MSNTRKIQPIQIWTANGQTDINTLALVNFLDYHFDDGSGVVIYKLIFADDNGAVEYLTQSIEIPSSVIQQWGASDDVIWNYVCSTLNLTII